MKYLIIYTKVSKIEVRVFQTANSKDLNRFYLKLRFLFMHDLPCKGNFYLVSDLPQEMFTQWEWGILSQLDNFYLYDLAVLSQWEWDMIKVIDALGMRDKVHKNLKTTISNKNKQILQNVRSR